jgi:hypothetical protein
MVRLEVVPDAYSHALLAHADEYGVLFLDQGTWTHVSLTSLGGCALQK